MSDAFISPLSGDYVIVNDVPVADPAGGLANAVYLRLMTPLGGWWADPTLGSRLHELVREKDVPRVQILAKQYAETALQPILDDGRAKSITITVEQPFYGRLNMEIEVIDARGERFIFNHPVQVG